MTRRVQDRERPSPEVQAVTFPQDAGRRRWRDAPLLELEPGREWTSDGVNRDQTEPVAIEP